MVALYAHTQTITEAIRDRRVLRFVYSGKIRTAEPHALGYDRDGDLTLSAWLLTGTKPAGWRDFHLAKLTGLTITDARFEQPRPGYNPDDSTLERIVCRL